MAFTQESGVRTGRPFHQGPSLDSRVPVGRGLFIRRLRRSLRFPSRVSGGAWHLRNMPGFIRDGVELEHLDALDRRRGGGQVHLVGKEDHGHASLDLCGVRGTKDAFSLQSNP